MGGGKRVAKHSLRVAAYGTSDEANAAIGIFTGDDLEVRESLKNDTTANDGINDVCIALVLVLYNIVEYVEQKE